MSASNYIHIDVDDILRETDNAFLVLFDGEEIWIPKSQVADFADYRQGDKNCTLSISKFIAKVKGIEYD